jgi:hypothetical protein
MKTNYSLTGGAKAILCLLSTTLLLGAPAAARADSPSEILEQAIYSEETKGDLDGAMTLYQQVIEQSKTSQALAAQAQYRLGVCQYKKQNYAAATAAFEALVKDYPDQKDIVALARDYLSRNSDLLPAPWADGEEARYDVKLGGGMKIGVGVWTADAGETNGLKIWRVGRLMSAGGEQVSRVEVEADTMKPIHSRWKHTLLGDADTVYSADHAEVKMAGKDDVKKIPFSGLVCDNEEAFHWMRRLPLAPGYKTTLPIVSGLGASMVPLKAEVTAVEDVSVPAGTFTCCKLELNIGQTFWIATNATREIVKFEGGGAGFELTGVRQRNPADAVNYQDAAGISLTAPPGWVVGSLTQETNKPVIQFLDPEVSGEFQLVLPGLDTFEPKSSTNSVRALAERNLADAAKTFKDFQVRSNTWQERTVAGQPAVSVVADYKESGKPRIAYPITGMANGRAVEFQFMLPAGDFEALRPKLDSIAASLLMK